MFKNIIKITSYCWNFLNGIGRIVLDKSVLTGLILITHFFCRLDRKECHVMCQKMYVFYVEIFFEGVKAKQHFLN